MSEVQSPSRKQSAAAAANAVPLLDVHDLHTQFDTPAGVVRAVDGVSYSLRSGETLGVVGESGCGKSVTALSILRLVSSPPGRIAGGAIRFEGTDLLTLSESEMEKVRGNRISMIFQEPMTSLNPLLTVGRQISEAVALHQGLSQRAAMDRGGYAAPGAHAGARAACARFSASAIRWHASAGDDRHGAFVQSQGADR